MASIKEKFPEFFQDKIETKDLEKKSNNTIVLDTNFLLDIIQNPTNIAEKYIEALEMVKENIYIPYLVALEFNFRKSGIKKEKHYNINKYKDKVKGTLKKLNENISDHNLINIKKDTEEFSAGLLKEVKTFESEILSMLDKKIATAITEEENTIYKKLIGIIEDKVGEEYSQEWIDEIETEGKERYQNKIPPGFDDENKEDTEESSRHYNNICYQRKFGDLIIWKDIINYSKNNSEIGSKIIYITNDGQSNKKSDLLYKVKDLIIGPHIYLMNELQKESQKELYILSNLSFIKLVTKLSDLQIEEIESLSIKRNKHMDILRDEYELEEIIEDIRNKELRDFLAEREKNDQYLISKAEELERLEILENYYSDEKHYNKKYNIDKEYNKIIPNKTNYNRIKNEIIRLKREINQLTQKNKRDEYNLRNSLRKDSHIIENNDYE